MFTEIIVETTGCETPEEYLEYLMEISRAHENEGRQASAWDYKVMVEVLKALRPICEANASVQTSVSLKAPNSLPTDK